MIATRLRFEISNLRSEYRIRLTDLFYFAGQENIPDFTSFTQNR